MVNSAHIDTFARDRLPPPEQQPTYLFDLPELQFAEQLNCAHDLLDRHIEEGRGERLCIRTPTHSWTYAQLQAAANRIAHVLVHEMGLVSGNRVLLRSPNNAMMAACWFGIVKAGGIVVALMPLLRAKELSTVVDMAQISHALCDASLAQELMITAADSAYLQHIRYFNGDVAQSDLKPSLEACMARAPTQFANVQTAATDTCILGFTSGTTGVPKATMHFHRDLLAVCQCWPQHMLKPSEHDVFIGSPPLAFTFGLGGLLLFPLAVGACTVLLEKASPPQLLEAIQRFGATVLFTAPTSYRVLAAHGEALRGSALRKCVSAGEALPASTRQLWLEATGLALIDGIGATELLHIFISHEEGDIRPGATGRAVPGYRAKVVDDAGHEVPPGTVGHLAVQGPTGCRYLADARQTRYVQNGWNLTGDAYVMDADGYFFYQARTDDMIISAGYNIAAPEVEEALMQHPAVAECAVIGVADAERGQIVKAFVVLHASASSAAGAGDPAQQAEMAKRLQDFVKNTIAPYKYPRAMAFVDALPRTATGKLQRFRLHPESAV